jgi:hypothetical protein
VGRVIKTKKNIVALRTAKNKHDFECNRMQKYDIPPFLFACLVSTKQDKHPCIQNMSEELTRRNRLRFRHSEQNIKTYNRNS